MSLANCFQDRDLNREKIHFMKIAKCENHPEVQAITKLQFHGSNQEYWSRYVCAECEKAYMNMFPDVIDNRKEDGYIREAERFIKEGDSKYSIPLSLLSIAESLERKPVVEINELITICKALGHRPKDLAIELMARYDIRLR